MESNASSPSLDNAEAKTAFKKPSNDTGTRRYRRKSPVSETPSPEKHERNSSPIPLRESSRRGTASMQRKDEERDLERDSSRNHHSRSGDTYRQSDRRSSRSNHDNYREANYNRRDKFIDEEDRHYSKSSYRSGRESRSDTHSDHYKSRHHSRGDEKYFRDKGDGSGHRSRDKDRDERREYRRGDEKGDRSPAFDSDSQRDKAGYRWKEELKRVGNQETSKERDRSDRSVFTGKNEDSPAKKLKPISLDSDYEKDAVKVNPEKPPATSCTSADIDAAKITAMKAAELVNKNLLGSGLMSADQKKKLLWGNKKSTPAEEQSSHRWDTVTFSDREQQEKFNKLMGVKVEAKADHKPNNPQSSLVSTEKVQLDLEKQYVAGLRRRDGRTVGLGL